MRGIVWAYDYETGLAQLEQIKENYQSMRITPIRERISKHSGCEIVFDNNDVWKMLPARESSRMCRTNISYIDRRIDQSFVQDIIKHCTIMWPYQAFRYYGPYYPEEKEVEYKWNIS